MWRREGLWFGGGVEVSIDYINPKGDINFRDHCDGTGLFKLSWLDHSCLQLLSSVLSKHLSKLLPSTIGMFADRASSSF